MCISVYHYIKVKLLSSLSLCILPFPITFLNIVIKFILNFLSDNFKICVISDSGFDSWCVSSDCFLFLSAYHAVCCWELDTICQLIRTEVNDYACEVLYYPDWELVHTSCLLLLYLPKASHFSTSWLLSPCCLWVSLRTPAESASCSSFSWYPLLHWCPDGVEVRCRFEKHAIICDHTSFL